MRTLLLVAFLFMSSFSYAQEYIDTPYGQKEVIIPSTYGELKQYYLLLSTMYFSSKYDIDTLNKDIDLLKERLIITEKALVEEQKKYKTLFINMYYPLVDKYIALESILEKSIIDYNELTKKYNALLDHKDFWQNYIMVGGEYTTQGFGFKLGYSFNILESIQIGVYTGFPLQFNLIVGIRF